MLKVFISSVQKELAAERQAVETFMIAECRAAGLSEPDFAQCGPHFVVTLWRPKAKRMSVGSASRSESGRGILAWGGKSVHVRVMKSLSSGALSRAQIATAVGHKSVSRALRHALADLMEARRVSYTMPEKPNSRLQRYQVDRQGKKRRR